MVAIVDVNGNPIKREELTEPQTARVGQLYQEFGSHPVRGLTPGKLASILEGAERGDLKAQCDLFEDMEEKDGHIMAEMGKRKRALLGLEWDIVPPRNATEKENKAAALVKELIQDIPNFEDVLLDMADAIGQGFSNLEYDWELQGKEWLPQSINHRPPSWFTVDRKTRMELRLRNNTADGEALQPFGWIKHVHKAKSGYVTRAGLHRVLAWPFLFKNYSVRDLAEFLEIYGLPMRIGEYPVGATDKEKATLLNAVINIGHAAAGIIPQGMVIDFKEAAKGNKDPFEAMIDWCERTQSKAILGGTLTSTAESTGMGSNLGDVHNEVRHDLMISDAIQIGSTLTRDLVYPLLALNTSGVDSMRRCPRFVFDTREPEDLKLYSEALPELVDIGMGIPVSYAQSKLKIPQAKEGEAILQRSTSTTPPPVAAAKGNVHMAVLKALNDTTVTDQHIAQLNQATEPAITQMLNAIKQLLNEVESLDEFKDRLIEAMPNMNADQLGNIMREGLIAAQLAGRYDILEQAGGLN